jgi:predicted phage terminase large subunit-like protein
MHTAGVGGPLTGRGGDVSIIDDPVKNAEEAQSKRYREKNWDWYKSTFESRCEPKGMKILMATRWHHEDLLGKVLASDDEDPDDWDIINLPALAKEADPLGREEGEALWPSRYNEKALAKIKKGNPWFPALYQQDPTPDEGDMFKKEHFRYYSKKGDVLNFEDDDGNPHHVDLKACVRFQTIDLAAGEDKKNDYTVISTWAMDGNGNLFLVDVLRERLYTDHLSVIRAQYVRHKPALIGVESTAFQLSLFKRLLRSGLPVKKLTPDKDKVTRAILAAMRMEAHTIFFPDSADYLDDIHKELIQFPNGDHDDFVDTLSYAAWGVSFDLFKKTRSGRLKITDEDFRQESVWK